MKTELKSPVNQPPSEMLWKLMSEIPDPEIPVINIVELGVVRNIEFVDGKVFVSVTPTYSGCPALKVIEQEIISLLKQNGLEAVIKNVLSPVWTTDWMNEEAKEKLRLYGIAPPEKRSAAHKLYQFEKGNIPCPRCKSSNTELISQFGSTACKALHRCKDCLEPFDYFKCH